MDLIEEWVGGDGLQAHLAGPAAQVDIKKQEILFRIRREYFKFQQKTKITKLEPVFWVVAKVITCGHFVFFLFPEVKCK